MSSVDVEGAFCLSPLFGFQIHSFFFFPYQSSVSFGRSAVLTVFPQF